MIEIISKMVCVQQVDTAGWRMRMKMMMKKVENNVDDGGGEDYPGHLPRAETLASRIALCLCPEASLWSFLRISSMFFFSVWGIQVQRTVNESDTERVCPAGDESFPGSSQWWCASAGGGKTGCAAQLVNRRNSYAARPHQSFRSALTSSSSAPSSVWKSAATAPKYPDPVPRLAAGTAPPTPFPSNRQPAVPGWEIPEVSAFKIKAFNGKCYLKKQTINNNKKNPWTQRKN